MTDEEDLAREAIRRTINGYNIHGDQRDGGSFAELFDTDGVLEFDGFGPAPGFRSEGLAEIRARTASWTPEPGKDPSLTRTRFIRHNLTTSEIELTGPDRARARTYFIVLTEGGPDHAGVYSDELVKRGEKWLFAHRRISLDWRAPASLFPPVDPPEGDDDADPRVANIELMNRYAHALDTRDWNLFADLFTADASFAAREWHDDAVPGEWMMTLAGPGEIVSAIRSIWEGLSRTHHMLSNHSVRVAGDRRSASASCYLRAHHIGNGERAGLFEESLGRFDFATERQEGKWRIARLEENIMIVLGTREAFAAAD